MLNSTDLVIPLKEFSKPHAVRADIAAVCCLKRSTSQRVENYYYTMGKKAGWRF